MPVLMYRTAFYTLINGDTTHKNNKYQKGDITQHDIAYKCHNVLLSNITFWYLQF